ncbi:MAG: transcriptional repressor [Acidobacteria bacterium]|nr:MAG: transcriptional repressor [Acidobacteriota bacterium]
MPMPESRKARLAVLKGLFYEYLLTKGLKKTQQRELILDIFLSAEHHVNVDDLIRRVREIDPTIGYATVYRTVNLFLESGIAQEIQLRDSVRRIEPLYQDEHHDHLICVRCGSTTEFFSGQLESEQLAAASNHGFQVLRHSLKIYGLCRKCQ